MLRTIIAPVSYQAGMAAAAEGWLREADAFCSAAGERALQRRVRQTLASIGAKVPKGSTSAVPPHLARLGITARETEILRLVNAGLSNAGGRTPPSALRLDCCPVCGSVVSAVG
jgi:hypothetical protein